MFVAEVLTTEITENTVENRDSRYVVQIDPPQADGRVRIAYERIPISLDSAIPCVMMKVMEVISGAVD